MTAKLKKKERKETESFLLVDLYREMRVGAIERECS